MCPELAGPLPEGYDMNLLQIVETVKLVLCRLADKIVSEVTRLVSSGT